MKPVFACYLGISAVCFWQHSKRVNGCSSCNETWWNPGVSETGRRGAREVVLLCKYVPGDGVGRLGEESTHVLQLHLLARC